MVKRKPTEEAVATKVSLEEVINPMINQDSTLSAYTVSITKESAVTLLEAFNNCNRPVSKGQCNLYANEMLRGKWKLNGEPLLFGTDENGIEGLISGQHRLLALIKANELYEQDPEKYPDAVLELETVIITGVDLEVADSVDLGMNRKPAHVLYRDEWVREQIADNWKNKDSRRAKWCNVLAGAARLVWLRQGGATVSSAPKFIVSEMLEFIKEEHPKLCKFVTAILDASEEDGGGLKISIPYIAALTYIASMDEEGKIVRDVAEKLLDTILCLAQGTGYETGSAAHALATYWNQLQSTPGSKDRDLEIVGPFVKALNAIIKGEKVTAAKLKLTKKEADTYAVAPPLLEGWDTAAFIHSKEVLSQLIEDAEAAKVEQMRLKEEQAAAKAEEKRKKAEEKLAAEEAKKAAKDVVAEEVAATTSVTKALASRGIKRKPVKK